MTKIKYILLYSTLILFLQCSGSGSGGCSFFNKTIEDNKVLSDYNPSSVDKEDDIIVDEDHIMIDKDDEPFIKVIKKDNEQKKAIKKNKFTAIQQTGNKPIKETISKREQSEPKSKKTLPKATYVPFTNAPEPIEAISPKYPKYELDNGIEGVVYIQFRIDTLGNVVESYIAKSSENENLDNAALNAILSSKWQPAKNQGKSTSVWQTLPFEFKLSN